MQPQLKRTSEELIDRAEEAKMLLASPMLKEVFAKVQSDYVQELLANPVGSLTASTAHASMKVLPAVEATLRSIVADYTIRERSNRGRE